jgi:penicillin-binding protein-related factor A (putative recombinase)
VTRHAPRHQSRRSHTGNVVERAIEDQHTLLAARGIAWMYRAGTPVTVIGHNADKTFVGKFTQKATVDYWGHTSFERGGRCIAVEVKHLAPKTLASGRPAALSLPASRFEPHQRAALHALLDAGGLALVLVASAGALYVAPWFHVPRRGSLKCLEYYRVPPGRLYLESALEAFP